MHPGFALTRKAFLAFVIVALSLVGHASGSTMLPSAEGVVLATVLTTALTVVVRPTMSAPRMFGVLIGVELLLHGLFTITSPSGHAHMGGSHLVPSPTSLAGHVFASMVAVWILRYGNQVLSAWGVLLRTALGAPRLPRLVPVGLAAVAAAPWDARTFGTDAPVSTRRRRGPPEV